MSYLYKKNTMKKILVSVLGLSSILFLAICFKNDNSDFDVEKEFSYMLVNKDVDETEVGGGSEEPQKEVKVYSNETKEYFNEVAYGREFDNSENNSLYKWETDMKIYVDGEKPEYLMSELRKIVSELNNIINPIDIKIVSSKSESNYVIYFGDDKTFDQKYDLYSPELLDHNWGYFELYYGTGVMYVDLYRTRNIESRKHLLREELTQSLGLVNDSYKYPESIFYQGWTTTTEFAPIDRELIDILYNN